MPFSSPPLPEKQNKAFIEESLARHFGRRFCCLTNRGTTALAAAFTALNSPAGARAIFPAAMCSIPVFAARFAGWRPDFADVNVSDGNFDLPDLEKRLSEFDGSVGAVVPLHMFGRMEDMDALSALCASRNVPIIEDVALSMGAETGGRKAGSRGRLSCLSFVRKMIPLEMGGAVLTDEPELDRRARAFVDSLPPPAAAPNETTAAMKAFHALTAYAAAGDWRERRLLLPFEAIFRRLLLARTEESDWAGSIVLAELSELSGVVGERRKRAEIYETVLTHPGLVPLEHSGSCFFAYPVRLTNRTAEGFLHFAEKKGLHFKRLAYPQIARVFGEDRPFPGADRLEKELIGFPVDDDQPLSSFWEYARDFQNTFEDYEKDAAGLPPYDWRGKMEGRMS